MFLKDDENKDGKSGNVAGSADTILRTRRIFKMKKNSGGRKKQSWKALNTRVVVKKSRHEKYLFLICFFKSRHEEYFCRSCFFKSGHGQ